jgi:hypothetical protein
LLLPLGVVCTPEAAPRPPVALSLQIGTRQSCGVFSGLDYDTSCLSAVYVAVRDADGGGLVVEQCTRLEARKAELGELLRGEAVLDFSGVSTDRRVIFEVRGMHDKGADGADRCQDAEDENHWLFWGESDVVDLTAFDDEGGNVVVPVVVDCRDCAFACEPGDCFGCDAIGRTCPLDTPESFCVPGVAFQCDKRCDDDGDCFEGARACLDTGFCDTREPTGGLCSPCALIDGVVDGCGDGFTCVGPPGSTQGFCAESCPAHFCVQGTRCNRIGNNLITITPPA